MTRRQPRDPVTGRYVSHRNTLYVKRLPVVLAIIYWLFLMGCFGTLMGTIAMAISFVIYISIKSIIAVRREEEADRAEVVHHLSDTVLSNRADASEIRERANTVAAQNRRRRQERREQTPEQAAAELRSYNEVDQFGYCMTCGALEKLHVDKYGRPMSPKDFHVSIDDDRWDEVHGNSVETENVQRAFAGETVVDSPSPATRRALNAAQGPQLWSDVAATPRQQAPRHELNPPF